MKPVISLIPEIKPVQSVVCIVGSDELPALLNLSEKEKEYAAAQLASGEDLIFINTYTRCVYILRTKERKEQYQVREELRRSACRLKKLIRSNRHTELAVTSYEAYPGAVIDFAEGLVLGMYSFSKYKSAADEGRKKENPLTLLLHGIAEDDSFRWLQQVTDAVWFTRDRIQEPVNHLNAVALASEIRKTGDEAGFTVEILNKGKIEALKMGGLLAVNRGSVDPPSFSILEWKPEGCRNIHPVVLVGKGIVYDTGGLNLKTGESMAGMKGDMAGAAIVAGVMYAVAKSNIPLHIIGLVPSTDNRPGGNAYTQGDIITMHNGLTVEIGNTDAEGRLILADAISYASRYRPELIINIATLTGSAAMTFSSQALAMMTNADRKYVDLLKDCGYDVYERIGELPFFEEYADGLKSDVADLKNIGNSREAGAIIAGKFLERFTDYPLIHLDIAGTELLKKDDFYRSKNGTASGLRLISEFLRRLAKNY